MADAVPQPKRSPFYRSSFFLVLIGVALVAGSVWLACYLIQYGPDTPQGKLGLKTWELIIQMILLVVAGGMFVQLYNRWQSKRAAINDFRKATLHSLIKAYSDTKKSRRTLRARVEPCITEAAQESSEAISCSAYDEYMNIVSDTQLSLEVVKRELRVFKTAFDDASSLIECVRNMENYLQEIIDEYERTLKLFHGKPAIPLSRLPRLSAFVVKGASSDFSTFSEAFHQSLALIQLERVKVA
ncbi:MAG TPA: hypothetical protein VHC97_20505 [Thermoanaerobaculia bacterium]|nr:hypothetical protein [Thermoanaerobaculia bacterium]